MKENLYTLLNHMDHQTENFNSEPLTEPEIEGWKNSFHARKAAERDRQSEQERVERRKYIWKGKNWAGYVAAAAVLTVVAVGPAGQKVYAGAKAVIYSLSELLGIEKDLSPYSTVVGQSVEKNGVTVTLSEVIMDYDRMLISCTTTFEEPITTPEQEAECIPFMGIAINGDGSWMGGSSGTEKIDDYTMVTCAQLELSDVDMTEEMDVKLTVFCMDETIGSFEFLASGEELAIETKTVELQETYHLPDKTELTFSKYTSNSLGEKIYFEIGTDICNYDLVLEGEDDLGNPVEFTVKFFSEGKGRMEVSTIGNEYVNENASSLILTPYAIEMPGASTLVSIPGDGEENDSGENAKDAPIGEEEEPVMMETEEALVAGGRLNTERIAIGEEFIINLK